MAYDVVVEPPAKRRFESAVQYYVGALGMPRSAKRLVDAFELATYEISQNPTFYPVNKQASRACGADVHYISVGKYREYFTVDKDSSTVHIFSFLHERSGVHFLSKDYRNA